VKIPVGQALGKLITECTVAELEAACDKVEADLCALNRMMHKARKWRQFVAAARPLLRQRKFPTGSYSTTEEANQALRDAAEVGWLITPSREVAQLLEGTAIVISAFRADVQLDTFADDEDPARRVPGKSLLDTVARDLGLSWDANLSKRTDNGSSPYVRSCQAAGRVRNFDGTFRDIQAHAEIDVRDGSPLANKIAATFGQRACVELARRRQFVLSHADTSARLRGIRQLGLRDTYLPGELEKKAFFTARCVFTGKSDNEATRQVFDEHIACTFLPSAAALFGSPKRAAGER
jgi:hypothetical protein